MLNRRRFVYGVLSAGLVGPHFVSRADAAQRTRLASLADGLSRDVFSALRQQTFSTVIAGRRMRLTLVEVTDDGGGPVSEQFTVVFQGPRGLPLRDGVCVLSHPTAGSAALYIQAAATSDGRFTHYKAAFNLLS